MDKPVSEVFCMDCMEYLKGVPDKFFALACVDPPYEIGTKQIDKRKTTYKGAGKLKGRILLQEAGKFEKWDFAPSNDYWKELFRVSKNQIVWGGNYFDLGPSRGIVVWDKCQPWENFSQVEMAWTSFDCPAKLFKYDNRTGDKIHICQKPVELYAYLFETFANEGDNILDTHMGSQSSRIAAYKMGLDYVGCEIDEDYFNKGCERFNRECLGVWKLKDGRTAIEQNLFDI